MRINVGELFTEGKERRSAPNAAKDVEEFTGGKIGAMFLTRLKRKSQAVHADERTGNLSSPAHQHITSADKRTGKLSSPPHC